MAQTSRRRARVVRMLSLAALLLAVNALLGGFASTAPAQTAGKKTDPGKTDKTKTGIVTDIVIGGGTDQVSYINDALEKEWAKNKITPSDRCSDYEFIRRASLDIIGRIAKPTEIERFMRDAPKERRSKLIDRLLASEEYATHFANLWSNLLLTRTGNKVYHEQMHLWLYEHFYRKDSAWDRTVAELLTATGRTNENGAVNYILAHLGEEIREDRGNNGRFEMVPVTSRTTRLFLGLRTQCTQCHDHPFNEEWRQMHFWGVNAFFRQVDAPKGRPLTFMKKKGIEPQLELSDNASFNKEGIVPYERRNGLLQFTKAVFLDGQKLPTKAESRRYELARFITKNEYFAKAFVNRTWGHFLGRSFIKEVDDFGSHNEVSHPALLDKLAKDFIDYKYDPRALMRWIANSKAYGLSSIANSTNDKLDAEPYFSRMILKAMSPEQLFESLMTATDAKVGKTRDNKRDLREQWLTKLIVNFGDDEGSEGSFNGTVVQALLMMNGKEINDAITDKEHGTVAAVLKKNGVAPARARAVMHQLYLAALNRPPAEKEYRKILSSEMMKLPRLPNPTPREMDAFYTAFYQDLFWALLNSNEFILNH